MDIIPKLNLHLFLVDDILYSQSDIAEQLYFLYEGEIKIYSDIAQEMDMCGLTNDKDKMCFNIQITHYTSGGYFGDNDSLLYSHGYRTQTAVCDKQSWIYLIHSAKLKLLLENYP